MEVVSDAFDSRLPAAGEEDIRDLIDETTVKALVDLCEELKRKVKGLEEENDVLRTQVLASLPSASRRRREETQRSKETTVLEETGAGPKGSVPVPKWSAAVSRKAKKAKGEQAPPPGISVAQSRNISSAKEAAVKKSPNDKASARELRVAPVRRHLPP